ncbi:MAG: hypothetical protein IPM42_20255 [Saprospiraceae bacterium]|nr:hypothetical protein [Saprospiraceae bacterium]
MKLKHQELIIPEDNPFENCKLAREPYARILTDIVNNYADGFVLAINNDWGAGKTTFVKMWQQQLKNDGFQTIYFNAWENDFDNNPLIALVSELETLINERNEKVFKSVVEKGAVLVKNIGPTLLKSLIKKYLVDIDDISVDTIENAAKASTEILEEEIREYSSKKKTINEFKKELEKFVNQGENSKPLIFIVDELDRCRPNYAVEVLEQIKHFFSVPGIVFVLSIDKKHLASSVKGFYGSEEINSDEYLRRFIDIEYSIPVPQSELFNEYLYEYYNFSDFFTSSKRKNIPEVRSDGDDLLKFAKSLFKKSNVTLRQQERVFALARLIICSFESNQYTFSHLLFFLVYLKTIQNDQFQKIEKKEFELQELSDLFYNCVYSVNLNESDFNLLYTEALLLWFYNNEKEFQDKVTLMERTDDNKLVSPIKSKLENGQLRTTLVNMFDFITRKNYSNMQLNYLIKKITIIRQK